MKELLELVQDVAFIKKCDSYDKLRRNIYINSLKSGI